MIELDQVGIQAGDFSLSDISFTVEPGGGVTFDWRVRAPSRVGSVAVRAARRISA